MRMERFNFSVKPRRKGFEGKMSFQVLGIWMGVLMVGVILFFHVWWPIQAERASSELKKLENDLSIKKSELDRLKTQYSQMISLASLESVAKSSGQWKNPSIEHVITISK
jgi:hypothetical protein